MNKKIVLSLATIAVVAAAGIGSTIAYFSSTQTSHGNIIKSGNIDLKVDHTFQSYNDLNCTNYSVTVGSDENNTVVATNGGNDPVVMPHAAAVVTPTALTQSAWAAAISGTQWIWATDPITENDARNNVTYTFQKKFDWLGDVNEATINFAVASDNGYRITLNGNTVADQLNTEFNYNNAVSITVPKDYFWAGENTLNIEVRNIGQPNAQDPVSSNPAGLMYQLAITGNPSMAGDSYFQQNCRLWTSKHLETGDTFFNFDDVKPGDWGTNAISVLVNSNPAWLCMGIKKDAVSSTSGEVLSSNIQVMAWKNTNSGKETTPGTGAIGPMSLAAFGNQGIYLPALNGGATMAPGTKQYIHLLWCAGTLDAATGTCNGSSMTDGQGQTLAEDLIFQAMQSRHNDAFTCPTLQ